MKITKRHLRRIIKEVAYNRRKAFLADLHGSDFDPYFKERGEDDEAYKRMASAGRKMKTAFNAHADRQYLDSLKYVHWTKNRRRALAMQRGELLDGELRAAIEEMGYPISDEHLKRLLSEFDADASSALDLLEFTALMARMLGYKELPEEQYKLLRKVFNYVDSDQDGNITPAELKAVVERFGLKMEK